MKSIAILGSGWLGTQLGKHLQSTNFKIKVSARSKEKCDLLLEQGLDTHQVHIDPINPIIPNEFFTNTDLLIVSLTPVDLSIFEHLVDIISNYKIPEVILFSSTGVYKGLSDWVNESTPLLTSNTRVKHLNAIEQLFLAAPTFTCTVIRLGGLIGQNRHPVKHLAKKKVIEDGNEPVNIATDEKILPIINKIVSLPITNDIYNLVNDEHRNKREFYNEAAVKFQIKLPEFIDNPLPKNRKVSNEKIKLAYKTIELL